jgi:hypothetical protein
LVNIPSRFTPRGARQPQDEAAVNAGRGICRRIEFPTTASSFDDMLICNESTNAGNDKSTVHFVVDQRQQDDANSARDERKEGERTFGIGTAK